MTDMQNLIRRIDQLESRNAITELGTRYAIACDEHNMPALLALFTDDAEFTSPSGVMQATGKAEIEAMFIRMFKIRGPAYHWTHDHIIEFDPQNPDKAHGIVLSHAETSPDGEGSLAAMKYEDHYAREDGQLKGIYGSNTFGDVSPTTHSLTELPCAEQSGLIWVCLTPGKTFNIDDWLADFRPELDSLDLNNWHIHEQRWLDGPGWKVAWDGYLEAYHHNTLHANTVGRYTIGNLMLHDTYGPHQRLVFARRTLAEMKEQTEQDWDPDQHLRQIHSVFPNLSISGVLGDHCLVSHVFPGPTPESTRTLQTVLVAKEPVTEAEKTASDAFSATVLQAVQEEDYPMGYKIQKGLAAGGNKVFTIGRNEPAIQHYHKWVKHFTEAKETTCS